jgi:hypothetical protein
MSIRSIRIHYICCCSSDREREDLLDFVLLTFETEGKSFERKTKKKQQLVRFDFFMFRTASL